MREKQDHRGLILAATVVASIAGFFLFRNKTSPTTTQARMRRRSRVR